MPERISGLTTRTRPAQMRRILPDQDISPTVFAGVCRLTTSPLDQLRFKDEGAEVQPLRACLVMGTRPEAIKLAPLLQACRRRRDVEPFVCSTGQHRELVQPVIDYFGLQVDVDLNLMLPDQSLGQLLARCIEGLDRVFAERQPDCVIAQGQTSTVLAAALAAYYRRIPFVHVEAGLRTGHRHSPWPEEMHRHALVAVTSMHCAPTKRAAQNLVDAGLPRHTIHITGFTAVDALYWALSQERQRDAVWRDKYSSICNRPMLLVTSHRRENQGPGLENICGALRTLATRHPQLEIVFPVHRNPAVFDVVHRLLSGVPNVQLLGSVSYPEFVWLMDQCRLVLSDSGTVQEEALALRKPLLLLRSVTERPEPVAAGVVELVGTSPEQILSAVTTLIYEPAANNSRSNEAQPYSDGRAAERIVDLVSARAWDEPMTVRRAA
ncbi:MAG: UDP-N-acetylglucosamine 2-epimerase (non-hydrolyzing) [Planctomycetales bacterium 12-60-4]|nr:MAG: UDP-N-acetylglucosamine 2-epimerase (non-hydrolyzing) [Planctomycetales bacterium 12-60-4]